MHTTVTHYVQRGQLHALNSYSALPMLDALMENGLIRRDHPSGLFYTTVWNEVTVGEKEHVEVRLEKSAAVNAENVSEM
ncbi:MAG: hypothetical protein ACYCYO_00290 [Bacilli bacterium]